MSIGVRETTSHKPLNCGQFRHVVMYIHMYVVSKGDCRVLFSEYKM